MPFKKKKCIRRQKITASSTFIKRKSRKAVNFSDVITVPCAAKEKLPGTSCKILKSDFIAHHSKDEEDKITYSPLENINDIPIISGKSKIKPPKKSLSILVNKKSSIKYYDNGGVKRIFSPFNRFSHHTKTANKDQISRMPYQSRYKQMGLSAKEKSYVICSCQSRSRRYVTLKNLAANAIRANKIFTIYGTCTAVRSALLERGWIEKITPNKMNLSKIRNGTYSDKGDVLTELERLLLSNFVEKYSPNFIWRNKEDQHDTAIDMSKECSAITNKLKIDALWTSKQGLCSSMKRNYWFYIENVADVSGPRSYNSYDAGEMEGFVKDYGITACTSLLKWILSMVANERPIFVETGKISIYVVLFALNRCKEYLFRKQNKDIDRSLRTATKGQWNAFIKKYHRIIAKDDVFSADKENKLPLYLCYAKFLLKEIHKYRPQLSCEGCHNIWIIKPAHCSRGRGIKMASKLALITNWLNKANSKYVVQKYIEEPLLIYETKFDIRQYYLVTSTYPLVIWMYRDCYLKFSSQKYNLKNYHESIHLTNNAVQSKYKNCSGRHPDLPPSNMWDLDKYKEYLNRAGRTKVWENIIYPGMRKSIIGIMLSCQDSLSVCRNRFELYGCDFILDNEYKPWLIEINSCPDLNATTQVTAKICPNVCADIIKVVFDHASNPKSPTGKFECIYRQPMTLPRYGGAADLFVRGFSLNNEYFYKGKIEIKESYEDADIEKERNIQYILSKLKNFYDSDIMVEPEEEWDTSFKREVCVQNTESEFELSVAASVITDQLDELIDRITSEHSTSKRSTPGLEQITHPASDEAGTQKCEDVKSETDMKGAVKISESHFASVEAIKNRECFKFSQLDDGMSGQISYHSLKKTLKHNSIVNNSKHEKKSSYNNVINVTNNLISFMSKKDKENHHKKNRKQRTNK